MQFLIAHIGLIIWVVIMISLVVAFFVLLSLAKYGNWVREIDNSIHPTYCIDTCYDMSTSFCLVGVGDLFFEAMKKGVWLSSTTEQLNIIACRPSFIQRYLTDEQNDGIENLIEKKKAKLLSEHDQDY